jgi:hypothetical protein
VAKEGLGLSVAADLTHLTFVCLRGGDSVTRRRLGLPAEWADAFQEQIDMIDWGIDNEQ